MGKKSISLALLQLIGNICSENPSLVEIIPETTLDCLFELLRSIKDVGSIDNIVYAVNFLHHICLKEGEVRNKVLKHHLDNFLKQLFNSNIFEVIGFRQFGQLWMALHRFMSNITKATFSIFGGLFLALKDISKDYKELANLENYLQEDLVVNQELLDLLNNIGKMDSKMIILLKIL